MDNLRKVAIIVGLVLAIAALCFLIKKRNVESFEDAPEVDSSGSYVPSCSTGVTMPSESVPAPALEGLQTAPKALLDDKSDPVSGNSAPANAFPKGQLKPSDLLPSQEATEWNAANPTGKGKLEDQNFLTAGFHVGINTVGQSLRNANMQIRSEPPNPQKKVGPWMQSTIEPDLSRKALEVGGEM